MNSVVCCQSPRVGRRTGPHYPPAGGKALISRELCSIEWPLFASWRRILRSTNYARIMCSVRQP